jgi:electron transport complex protein RnfG
MDPAKSVWHGETKECAMSEAGIPSVSDQSESSSRIFVVVLTLGVLCSLAIVATYEWTRPIIAANKTSQRRQAVLELIPQARDVKTFALDESTQRFVNISDIKNDAEVLFAGFDPSGQLVGVAMIAQGMGYQDVIQLLYAYAPETQTLTGIRVLESRETPGLGDRIETDANFLRNFQSLDVRVQADGAAVENEITYVKPGEKTKPWQVDGITGATVSTRAVAEILRLSTNHWVPRVRRSRDSLQLPSGSSEQQGLGEQSPNASQRPSKLEGELHVQ